MITPIDINDIPRIRGRNGSNIQDVMDFLESGGKACLIDLRGRTPRNVRQMMDNLVRNRDLPIHVHQRGDRIYLIRKDL